MSSASFPNVGPVGGALILRSRLFLSIRVQFGSGRPLAEAGVTGYSDIPFRTLECTSTAPRAVGPSKYRGRKIQTNDTTSQHSHSLSVKRAPPPPEASRKAFNFTVYGFL
jgi:hypothetical protein